jgi:hypothetical protein
MKGTASCEKRAMGAQAAKDDRRGQQHDADATKPGRHAKGALHRPGNGVGLNRVEDEAEGKDEKHREQGTHPTGAQPLLHVIGRPAAVLPAVVTNLEQLRECRFDETGRHTDQGDYPHPEHRARATERDGDRHPGDVAGAHPRGE